MSNKSNKKYYINDYSTSKNLINSSNSSIIKYINSDKMFNVEQFILDFSTHLGDEFIMTTDQVLGITNLTEFLSGSDSIFGLFGYAGTGKTSIIIHYIYYLLNNNYIQSIAISAPTNVAVDILKSKFLDLYELDLRDIKSTMTNTIDDIISIYEKKGKKITFATEVYNLFLYL